MIQVTALDGSTLEVIEEDVAGARVFRVRVREHFGKASVFLTRSQLEALCQEFLELVREGEV